MPHCRMLCAVLYLASRSLSEFTHGETMCHVLYDSTVYVVGRLCIALCLCKYHMCMYTETTVLTYMHLCIVKQEKKPKNPGPSIAPLQH